MAVFIENQKALKEITKKDKATIRFQINQKHAKRITWKALSFIFKDLEWSVVVYIKYGVMHIGLECLTLIPESWHGKVRGNLIRLNNETNAKEKFKQFHAQKFTEKDSAKFLIIGYQLNFISPPRKVLTFQLDFYLDSNIECNLPNVTFRKGYQEFKPADSEIQRVEPIINDPQANNEATLQIVEKMKTEMEKQQATIDELRQKLAIYEEDKENINIFKHALRLFGRRSCYRYERELKLANNLKVNLCMVPSDAKDKSNPIDEYKKKNEKLQDDIERIRLNNIALTQRQTAFEANTIKQQQVKLDELQKNLENMIKANDDLNSRNEELIAKISFIEDDQENISVFVKALSLFKMKICTEFKYEMKLGDNSKLNFEIVSKASDESNNCVEVQDDIKVQQRDLKSEEIKLENTSQTESSLFQYGIKF